MANIAVTAIFILFNTMFQTVQCHSSGAPISECALMTPNHGVSAQSGTSPYLVKTEKPYYMPGENVKVSIESSSDDIKGYLIQARLVGTNSATGMFATLPANGKYVSCGNQKGAVTHTMGLSLKTINFEWQPPSSASGNISFYATVVKDRSTFWVKLSSPELYKKEMHLKPVTDPSPSPSVFLSRTAFASALAYHPATSPSVYRSRKASVSAMAKLLESPSVSRSRKAYASAVTNPTPSPSVSASPTQENNMCKVNDPKCAGAELNYNISILLLIALIACILA